jgi:hypothetical protein
MVWHTHCSIKERSPAHTKFYTDSGTHTHNIAGLQHFGSGNRSEMFFCCQL